MFADLLSRTWLIIFNAHLFLYSSPETHAFQGSYDGVYLHSFSGYKIPYSIFQGSGLVVMNYFELCWSYKVFNFPKI